MGLRRLHFSDKCSHMGNKQCKLFSSLYFSSVLTWDPKGLRRFPLILPFKRHLSRNNSSRICIHRRIEYFLRHVCLSPGNIASEQVPNPRDPYHWDGVGNALAHHNILCEKGLASSALSGRLFWNRHGVFIHRIGGSDLALVRSTTKSCQRYRRCGLWDRRPNLLSRG